MEAIKRATREPQPALGPTPQFLYRGPVQEESLARLHYLIDNQKRVGLLIGPDGSGKTLVLEALARELRDSGHRVIALDLLAMDGHTFLWQLATGLDCRTRMSDTPRQLWQSITDACEANRYLQLPTVLLIDDVDQAAKDVMAPIFRLLNACLKDASATTVIFSANVANLALIDSRILDLAALRIELETWSDAEVGDYLKGALESLGIDTLLFDTEAVTRLHALTCGQPRRVCQLANLVLAAAVNQHWNSVDANMVEAIAMELTSVSR